MTFSALWKTLPGNIFQIWSLQCTRCFTDFLSLLRISYPSTLNLPQIVRLKNETGPSFSQPFFTNQTRIGIHEYLSRACVSAWIPGRHAPVEVRTFTLHKCFIYLRLDLVLFMLPWMWSSSRWPCSVYNTFLSFSPELAALVPRSTSPTAFEQP